MRIPLPRVMNVPVRVPLFISVVLWCMPLCADQSAISTKAVSILQQLNKRNLRLATDAETLTTQFQFEIRASVKGFRPMRILFERDNARTGALYLTPQGRVATYCSDGWFIGQHLTQPGRTAYLQNCATRLTFPGSGDLPPRTLRVAEKSFCPVDLQYSADQGRGEFNLNLNAVLENILSNATALEYDSSSRTVMATVEGKTFFAVELREGGLEQAHGFPISQFVIQDANTQVVIRNFCVGGTCLRRITALSEPHLTVIRAQAEHMKAEPENVLQDLSLSWGNIEQNEARSRAAESLEGIFNWRESEAAITAVERRRYVVASEQESHLKVTVRIGKSWGNSSQEWDELSRIEHLYRLEFIGAEILPRSPAQLGQIRGLESLIFHKCAFPESSFSNLPLIPQLTRLALTDCGVSNSDLSFVAQFPRLKSLELADNPVGDAGVESLRTLPLEFLDLDGTRITDQGLQAIRECSAIKILTLRRTRITGAGLKHLVDCTELERLSIPSTVLDEVGGQHIARMPALQEITLDGTEATPGAIVRLKASRPHLLIR